MARHDDTATIKEELDRFRHRQAALFGVMAIVNIGVCAGMAAYYRMKEQALVGYTFLKNSDIGKQLAHNYFEMSLSGANITAGADAMESAGFGRSGFNYISRLNGEIAALVTVVTVMAAIFILCITHCLRLANKPAYTRAVELEDENAQIKSELESRRIHNERQQEKMQSFIENIAHQIKTPLQAISMKLELMKETVDGEDVHSEMSSMIDVGLENTFKIKRFIKRLLDISRFESGKVIMASDEVEIDSILLESIGASECENNRIVTDFRDGGTTVYADETWLVEAFVNIINNCGEAVKDNENARIYIDIVAAENQQKCVITIADNGKGLSVEDFNRIFDRFETDAGAAEFRFGIGMNLSKLIIESLHGRVKAGNSEEYGGAEFKIELPTMKFKSKM